VLATIGRSARAATSADPESLIVELAQRLGGRVRGVSGAL
jgi:hypothetical protein